MKPFETRELNRTELIAEIRTRDVLIEQLKEDVRWLRALEAAGVGNWEGYEYATELFAEGEPK